jgi:cell division septal protein FtsQ
VVARRHSRRWAGSLGPLVPNGRSLLAGLVVLALGLGGYVAARTTSAFGVRDIEVRGAPSGVAADVRAALDPLLGRSLLDVRGSEVEQRVEAIPAVASASYDRAFPHALVVVVRPEHPIAVLRSGDRSWLLSARGRVLQQLVLGAKAGLPRLWVPRGVEVGIGERVGDPALARALRVLVPLAADGLPARVKTVRTEDELTLVFASGLELRLGDETDLELKLAVARRLLPLLSPPPDYLDVSVPERPVSPADPQLSS